MATEITLTCDTCGQKVDHFSGTFEDHEMYFGPKTQTKFEFCNTCKRTIVNFIKLETEKTGR